MKTPQELEDILKRLHMDHLLNPDSGVVRHDAADAIKELRSERDELAALVGTLREIMGCTKRNVSDLTPEQHSREMGSQWDRLHAAATRAYGKRAIEEALKGKV